MYLEAMQSPAFEGVYNATAPNPVRMSELCSSLGSTLGRPSWLPVPDFALTVRAARPPCHVLPAGLVVLESARRMHAGKREVTTTSGCPA